MSTSQGEEASADEHVAPPEAWDAIALGYDRYVAPQEVDLANEALRLVDLEPGERFLDVAAGTGGLSLPAARLGAEVLATDWSPAMIERFEARVREEGLSKAGGRVMDCHALDLPDDSFDVTGSQFGVMLVPDQPRAIRRVVGIERGGVGRRGEHQRVTHARGVVVLGRAGTGGYQQHRGQRRGEVPHDRLPIHSVRGSSSDATPNAQPPGRTICERHA